MKGELAGRTLVATVVVLLTLFVAPLLRIAGLSEIHGTRNSQKMTVTK
jgi:hypothetical protein